MSHEDSRSKTKTTKSQAPASSPGGELGRCRGGRKASSGQAAAQRPASRAWPAFPPSPAWTRTSLGTPTCPMGRCSEVRIGVPYSSVHHILVSYVMTGLRYDALNP